MTFCVHLPAAVFKISYQTHENLYYVHEKKENCLNVKSKDERVNAYTVIHDAFLFSSLFLSHFFISFSLFLSCISCFLRQLFICLCSILT